MTAMREFNIAGAESGHLIVFDRSRERTWEERIFRREPPSEETPITVWGM